MYYITARKDSASLELANRILRYLSKKNIRFAIDKNINLVGNKKPLNETEPDFILAVGDDNIMLRTFRELGKREIPVLGIASMQSFLAQSDANNFQSHLELINKKKHNIFKRARIVAKVDNKKYSALNDIGIFSSKSSSLVRYDLNIND